MDNKNKYDLIFEQSLQKLNANQREAVKAIEGPVLVNAGPGTGKTQILATRIGKILRDTDIFPHNILCLTFTDAATIAMRNRLVSIIGPTAHQIHIFTFHGFCNQVIQENLDFFGGYRQLEPITDLEKLEIFKTLIDDLPNDNILKRFKKDKYFEKSRMENLFRLMKKENISVSEFISIIDTHLEEVRNGDQFIAKRKSTAGGKTYEKGDFRDDHYQKYERSFLELKAAVYQYPEFEKLMLKNERYDYEDMILWVLKAFEENEYLLLQYQERYQYFLVDEYQDTNGAQNDILNQLISYWDQPNVFVVGDDDQAIFKFQGANLRNLMDFKHRYNPLTIVLDENYRSNPHILNASMQLISNNKERIVVEDKSLTKNIRASGIYKSDDTLPNILSFKKQSAELAYIANEIQKIAQNNPEELMDTAIIYRKHRQVDSIINIFEKKNIKYNVRKRVNILNESFIKNLINLLKYLAEEYEKPYSASYRLYDLLHYNYFEIQASDCAKIIHYIGHKKDELKSNKLRDIISDEETLKQIALKEPDKILSLSEKLENWISAQSNQTLQMLFQSIINEGNILTCIMSHNEKAWMLQLLSTLFDFIKNETARQSDVSLKELMKILDMMIDNNLELPINKNISSEAGVNFVTAHSAKGLEFKNVFMLGCTKDIWDKNSSNRNNYKYPENVNTSSQINTEDERRLFYVAMTRAKTHLHISYSEANDEGKDLGASLFVDEVLEGGQLKVSYPDVSEETLIEFYYDIMRQVEIKVDLIEKDLIDDLLKDYKLSVTHLNKYLKCPLSFYFEIVLRVPSARNASTGFGTAMHDALRSFFEQYRAKKLKDLTHLLYFFEESMNKHKSHFTEEEFESYMDTGKMTLEQVYDDRMEKWLSVPKFAIEEELSHADVDGIPIKGFLDKVEIFENHVNVVDYKTGNPANAKKKTYRPSDRYPHGGDYWRQLVFYKLLLMSDKKHNWNMQSAEIDFLEPDRKTGEFSNWKYVVTPEDIDIVKEQIKDSHARISNYQFDKGCGESDCFWCAFAEKNNLVIE